MRCEHDGLTVSDSAHPQSGPDWSVDLTFAIRMADAADATTVARFGAADLVVEQKPDLTPVSDADRATEQVLREALRRHRPGDAVLGEEFGSGGAAQRCWILDPIDGTKNYVRGVPVWATLIALCCADEVVVSVVSAPALGVRWWAARGRGAWAHREGTAPRQLSVSAVRHLEDASVSFSEVHDPAWHSTGAAAGFDELLHRAWRTRAFGDFWSHMLVAEGAVDIAVEPALSAWDMAALVPIVEEAGGRISALDGSGPLQGGNAVSTNGLLHEPVLALFASSATPVDS